MAFSWVLVIWPHLDVRGGAWSCSNLMCQALSKPMEVCRFLNGDEEGADGKGLDGEMEERGVKKGGETGGYIK